ncbi:MAG: hypothetical protein ACMVO3_04450 [Thalassobaculum sp.]|jgi:hypothetical protein
MPHIPTASSLRAILFLDAAACVAMAIPLTMGAEPIAELTRLPQPLLFFAGLSLLPVAALIVVIARWFERGRAVWLVIGGNAAWIAASLALIAGVAAPNAWGVAFILAQALAVAVLTGMEYVAVRSAPTA